MSGVPHRSLLRSVHASSFARRGTWLSTADIDEKAIADFTDEDDPETSLWTDGDDGERQLDVLLALAFKRRALGKLALAALWQDEPMLGELSRRIIQSDGDTPYVEARALHYHVSNPKATDYASLALASTKRDLIVLSAAEMRELIEDAFVANSIPGEGLAPTLKSEIDAMLKRRFIEARELNDATAMPVFDIRDSASMSRKIPRANLVPEAHLESTLHRLHIGKGDVFALCCDDGEQSMRVARKMRQSQKEPRVLIGGLREWIKAGLPTEPVDREPTIG